MANSDVDHSEVSSPEDHTVIARIIAKAKRFGDITSEKASNAAYDAADRVQASAHDVGRMIRR